MDSVLLFLPALACLLFERRTWRCLLAMALGWLPLVPVDGLFAVLLWFSLPEHGLCQAEQRHSGRGAGRAGMLLSVELAEARSGHARWRSSPAWRLRSAEGCAVYLRGGGHRLVSIVHREHRGRFHARPFLDGPVVCRRVSARVGPLEVGGRMGAWRLAASSSWRMLSPRPFGYSRAERDPMSEPALLEPSSPNAESETSTLFLLGNVAAAGAAAAPRRISLLWLGHVGQKSAHTIAATFRKKLVVGFDSVGFCGFYAGPDVWIVDYYAPGRSSVGSLAADPRAVLADWPLLAIAPRRLSCDPADRQELAGGAGVGGILRSSCVDHARRPVGRRRLAAIWNMNLGRYDRLLEPAAERSARRSCRAFSWPPIRRRSLRELNRKIAAHPKEPLFYACRGMFVRQAG